MHIDASLVSVSPSPPTEPLSQPHPIRCRVAADLRMAETRAARVGVIPAALTAEAIHQYLDDVGLGRVDTTTFWFAWQWARELRAGLKARAPELLAAGIVPLPHPLRWQDAYALFSLDSRGMAVVHRLLIDLCDHKLRQARHPGVRRVVRYAVGLQAYDDWRERHGYPSGNRVMRRYRIRCLMKVARAERGQPLPEDLWMEYQTKDLEFDRPRPLPELLLSFMH